MSTRAKAAAAAVSASVIALGWQIGTAGGQSASGAITTDGGTPNRVNAPVRGHDSGDREDDSDAGLGRVGQSAQTNTNPVAAGTHKDGTFTGSTATHRFGSVAVTVTISNGAIADVQANVVSDGDRKSDMINNRSIPIVKSEVLAANSANVSTVGGATYTTEAYLTSLQSALDQAR